MLRSVLAKTIRDQYRSLFWWLVSVAVIVLMYAAIWPSMKGQPSISEFLDQMPEALRNLFATSGADLSTPAGYIQVELLSFMAPILLILYAVGQGSAAVAGEEDHHTLDLLLSAPVSRSRVVLDKAVAMVLGTVLLAAATGVALVVEGKGFDMDLPVEGVAAAMLHLALLAMVFGALALALGATTGHLGLSRAIPAVVAVVAYIVNGLGPMVDWLEPFQQLSPFHQYMAHDPLRHGVSWSGLAIAAATVVVLVGIAVAGLRRRDVRG
jgi:ABC-2 type transport system permease protein